MHECFAKKVNSPMKAEVEEDLYNILCNASNALKLLNSQCHSYSSVANQYSSAAQIKQR